MITKSDILEIKNYLQTEGGHKVSIKKGRNSMNGYVIFRVIGRMNEWDYDFCQLLKNKYHAEEPTPTFVTNKYELSIYVGIELHNMEFRKKRKRKIVVKNDSPIVPVENEYSGPWGTKPDAQQLRMDRAARRHSSRVRRGVPGPRYW